MAHCPTLTTATRSQAAVDVRRNSHARRAVATVELALVLPFLVFMLVAGMDYSRVFYASVIVSNCARNGALWASDANLADHSAYDTVQDAAAADAVDLDITQLQVTELDGTDAQSYGWAQVTVSYPFQTVINYPGIPSPIQITRATRMRKVPIPVSP
jgi:Flp pilus assembly protein TadG